MLIEQKESKNISRRLEEEEEEEEEETSQLFVYKTENVNIPERRKCSWK